MTSANLFHTKNNSMVPIQNFLKRTKQVDLTVTGTNWTTVKAVGVAYADSTGAWRLTFNISGSMTAASRTGVTLTVTGITFKNTSGFAQAVHTIADVQSLFVQTYCNPNTGNLVLAHGSTTTEAYNLSEDVALESKPTWADANMENPGDVVAYIPFGQAGSPGEVIEVSSGSPYTPFMGSGVYTTLASINLTQGTWLLHAQSGLLTGDVSASPSSISFGISLLSGNNVPIYVNTLAVSVPSVPNTSFYYQMRPLKLVVTTPSSYYLNQMAVYSGGNSNSFHAQELCYICAVRLS